MKFRAVIKLGPSVAQLVYGPVRVSYEEAKKDLAELKKKHPNYDGMVLRPGDPGWKDD